MTKPIYDQVDTYLKYCASRNQSKMTLASKRHTYNHFIVESEVSDMHKMDNAGFDRWLAAQSERGVSVRTINTRMAHILAMIRYFREMGMEMPIKLPLIQKLKDNNPPKRVFYSRQEIEYVLEYADDLEWLLIKIGFDTGMRISEIRNMHLSQISGRQIIFVGKGSKRRESYMSQEARDRLNEWIVERDITEYLWSRKSGQPYSVDEIRIIMRKAFHQAAEALQTITGANKSGFDEPTKVAEQFLKFHPHALRHSFGSDLQTSGAELLEIQQMMGHEDAATTQRYLHGLDGHLENLFDKYKTAEALDNVRREHAGSSTNLSTIEARMDLFMDGMMAIQEVLTKMQNTR